jgi:hypothetical protein
MKTLIILITFLLASFLTVEPLQRTLVPKARVVRINKRRRFQ